MKPRKNWEYLLNVCKAAKDLLNVELSNDQERWLKAAWTTNYVYCVPIETDDYHLLPAYFVFIALRGILIENNQIGVLIRDEKARRLFKAMFWQTDWSRKLHPQLETSNPNSGQNATATFDKSVITIIDGIHTMESNTQGNYRFNTLMMFGYVHQVLDKWAGRVTAAVEDGLVTTDHPILGNKLICDHPEREIEIATEKISEMGEAICQIESHGFPEALIDSPEYWIGQFVAIANGAKFSADQIATGDHYEIMMTKAKALDRIHRNMTMMFNSQRHYILDPRGRRGK